MTLLRTGLIFIGGGACGAGLAAAYLSVTLTQGALPNAPPQPVAEAAIGAPGTADSETRSVFAVTGEERAHIRSQMLEFLVDLQGLNTALADSDRQWVHEIASAQGARAPDTVGRQLREKAPEGFSQISQSLRSEFTALAAAAESEPIEDLQERVSLVTAKCVACHGSYTVATQSAD